MTGVTEVTVSLDVSQAARLYACAAFSREGNPISSSGKVCALGKMMAGLSMNGAAPAHRGFNAELIATAPLGKVSAGAHVTDSCA